MRRAGLFVAGKFEQYKRDIPYFTLVQALRELVLDILAESEDEHRGLAASSIAAALGPNGQLIVDVIPQLELVIGPQPPVPELPLGRGARTGLRRVLRAVRRRVRDAGAPAGAVPRRPAVGRPRQP